MTTRHLGWLAAAAAAVLAVAIVADLVVPPAQAGGPRAIYVDGRIGSDSNDGSTPKAALETLRAALRRAEPDTQILLMGYGHRLPYAGTAHECPTLRGREDAPITIRRNIYTNTLHPAVLTTTRQVEGDWRLEQRTGVGGRVRTWSTPWPYRIRLSGDPDNGFIKLGAIAIYGYTSEPPPSVIAGAWWKNGRLYIRHDHYDPNEFEIFVKNGDGLCLSGDSAHVRIDDLSVMGAAHAVRVEPGAVDVRVRHLVRHNVLDDDLRGDLR